MPRLIGQIDDVWEADDVFMRIFSAHDELVTFRRILPPVKCRPARYTPPESTPARARRFSSRHPSNSPAIVKLGESRHLTGQAGQAGQGLPTTRAALGGVRRAASRLTSARGRAR
ncbi:hypothetical protein HNR05_003009 [Leifsonia psychrotolerans]|uniref:Uncharacterized protein n=1 Tax=Glaciibacter psychrotolerans TaxID=670054 RepID=A0A7Z0J7Q7_9MICO|nr:hypothetical protein [Leifsonia psychrotolerans]